MNPSDRKFPFNKTRLVALPSPDSGDITYHDTHPQAHGLKLRVFPSGVKTFILSRRLPGRTTPIRCQLGHFVGPDGSLRMTVEQARKAAVEAAATIATGGDPSDVRRQRRAEPTLAELFADFTANKRNKRGHRLSPRTIDGYRSDFNNLANLASHKLSAIRPTDIEHIYTRIGRNHPTQANRVRAMVHSLFEYGIVTRQARSNPASAVRKIYAENERDRFLRADELPRFLAALDAEENPVMRDYFKILLFTGARRSNVMAMRWDQIDFSTHVWRIPHTKNGTPQQVALTKQSTEVLSARFAARRQESPYVFPGSGACGHLTEPKKGWKRILDRDELTQLKQRLATAGIALDAITGEEIEAAVVRARTAATKHGVDQAGARLENLRPHDLRRTMGSWMAMTGASMPIIGKTLNHLSPQSTKIYARLDLTPVRDAMEAATEALLSGATDKV